MTENKDEKNVAPKEGFFNELLDSVKEMDAIAAGTEKPSRTFECADSDANSDE